MIKIKILLFISGAGFLVFNEVGIMQLVSLYSDGKEAQNQLNQKYMEINNLNVEIEKLVNDSTYQKIIARQKYQMAEKDEKIYRVENQKFINAQ